MLKRTLVFENPCQLSLRNCQLVINLKECPEERRSIPIEDIGFVIIDNSMISVTMPLLNALSEANIAVVFCNSKGMPSSVLYNLETNNLQGEVLRNQIGTKESLKKQLWKQIVTAKIKNQAGLLNALGKNGKQLKPLWQNVLTGDSENREGIAARLYFKELFGKNFIRERSLPGINVFLNYGYTILRAATTRSLMGSGLFPAIGIFHHNRSNAFPLADDIMEPYRPYVDEIVFSLLNNGYDNLTTEVKGKLINVLYSDARFEKVTRPLSVGLTITTASLVKCLAKEEKLLRLPSYE